MNSTELVLKMFFFLQLGSLRQIKSWVRYWLWLLNNVDVQESYTRHVKHPTAQVSNSLREASGASNYVHHLQLTMLYSAARVFDTLTFATQIFDSIDILWYNTIYRVSQASTDPRYISINTAQ